MAMQIAAQRDRNKLAVEQATVSRDLATQGFVSAVEQRRREDARISQAQALSGLNQQLAAKQGELVELRYALTELPAHSAARVATMRSAAAATHWVLRSRSGASVGRAPRSSWNDAGLVSMSSLLLDVATDSA